MPDVMSLSGVPDQEAPVEVVDEVGRAPVELRADGGHVGRGEGRQHQAAQAGRQMRRA